MNKEFGERFFKKVHNGIANGYDWQLMDRKELDIYFSKKEVAFIENILNFCPEDLNLKYECFGIHNVPRGLMVSIENQRYELNGKIKVLKKKFLPKNVFNAFLKMNAAMEARIGRRLNVFSGYRSPVYQALTFFHVLYLNNWDLKKTLRRVAIPCCSEHCNVEKQGIDFAPVKGISNLKDFYKTKEYNWLNRNAFRFGFYISYPIENNLGIDFEPWHWRFSP